MIAPLPKKILIVDDDLAIRRLLEVCLRQLPANQVAVGGGQQALEVMRREKIDLVVTDLMMPVTGGLDIVTAMRSDPALREIPVVMLSCIGNPGLPATASAAGVQAYFSKPFSPSQLIGVVRRLLSL